jgi:hypothetical protein
VRRPSNNERFWVRNLLVAVGGAYSLKVLVSMAWDGSLQRHITNSKELVESKIYEHVVEPLTKLKVELFDTIRSGEDHIVAKEDLALSKGALERMLSDFSRSKEGQSLIVARLNEAKEEILRNKERIFSKDDVATILEASNSAQIHTIESIRTGDPLKDLNPTPEQALVALMNEYEKELQTPVRGILFGNLFTAILIQVNYCLISDLSFFLFVRSFVRSFVLSLCLSL